MTRSVNHRRPSRSLAETPNAAAAFRVVSRLVVWLPTLSAHHPDCVDRKCMPARHSAFSGRCARSRTPRHQFAGDLDAMAFVPLEFLRMADECLTRDRLRRRVLDDGFSFSTRKLVSIYRRRAVRIDRCARRCRGDPCAGFVRMRSVLLDLHDTTRP